MEKRLSTRGTFVISWIILLAYYFISVAVFTYLYQNLPDKPGTLTCNQYPMFILESLYWRMFHVWWWTLIARIIEFLLFFLCTIIIAYRSYQRLFRVNFLRLCFAFCIGSIASFIVAITSVLGDWNTGYGLAPLVFGPWLFMLFITVVSLLWLPQIFLLLLSLYLTYKAVINQAVNLRLIAYKTPQEIQYQFPSILIQGMLLLAIAQHVSHGIGFILNPFFSFMPPVSQWLLVLLGSAYLATIGTSILYIANRLYEIGLQVSGRDNF